MNKEEFTRKIIVNDRDITTYDIAKAGLDHAADMNRIPFSIRVLAENLLRRFDGRIVTEDHVRKIAGWQKNYESPVEIPFYPARVLMQDFTGVPAVIDMASMRDAMVRLGGDPSKINPQVPVDLIVDHSVQVDHFGTPDSVEQNTEKEYERNSERYRLLKWAQKNFDRFRVVPPRSGICHQVNLEYLGRTVIMDEVDGILYGYPDTLVGTDSHTTMINSIGVLGWGVGGIEAEVVMLGQPYYMTIPEVVGVKFTGSMHSGVTATDLVLHVTKILRDYNVVNKFVEFFGPGVKNLSVPDRATIANMAPEYGATIGYFPVDDKTLEYFTMTNRSKQSVAIDKCSRALHLFYSGEDDPEYTSIVEVDLAQVEPSLAGPARPQDRIGLQGLKDAFAHIIGCEYQCEAEVCELSTFFDESGSATTKVGTCVPVNQRSFDIEINGRKGFFGDGSIVIAAITSCTNTSNPSAMLGAGLLARKAVERGLQTPAHVKTSLAPGSKVVTDYLEHSGLAPYLETLGFHLVAYGCTTCIGNSGPLIPEVRRLIETYDLNVASVLSGNRNFEARIHQNVKSNFLASPMLVIAFALAGRIDMNLEKEPLGIDKEGNPVHLREIWPTDLEIREYVEKHVRSEFFRDRYQHIFDGDDFWEGLESGQSATYPWDSSSTYIKEAPYFNNVSPEPVMPEDIDGAKVLLMLGDTVTTDHISPAGAIPSNYPAGKYLLSHSVPEKEFNSYGSRRGNHDVMMRGSFANIRIKNKLVEPEEGSFTLKFPKREKIHIFDAAMKYMEDKIPLLVIAGKEYGIGSSRDWAAKGTLLLGVKAVLACSFERIHRSNLVGMGVLPLVFKENESVETLGLSGTETYAIQGIENMFPQKILRVKATGTDGGFVEFEVITRLDTGIEVEYFNHGGILPFVLRKLRGKRDN